eukprot:1319689-Rhodomonas_salina.1
MPGRRQLCMTSPSLVISTMRPPLVAAACCSSNTPMLTRANLVARSDGRVFVPGRAYSSTVFVPGRV